MDGGLVLPRFWREIFQIVVLPGFCRDSGEIQAWWKRCLGEGVVGVVRVVGVVGMVGV